MAKRRKEKIEGYAVEIEYSDGTRGLTESWPIPRSQARSFQRDCPDAWKARVVKLTGTLYIEPAR